MYSKNFLSKFYDEQMQNLFELSEFFKLAAKRHGGSCAFAPVLREPKFDKYRLAVTEADVKQYESSLTRFLDEQTQLARANGGDESLVVNRDPNGDFVYPCKINNIPYIHDERETARQEMGGELKIYLGLHPSKIFDFMKIFNSECQKRNLKYIYKFFSATSADRVVIYPFANQIFEFADIIEKISSSRPELFEGAADKFFTSKICKGASVAIDPYYAYDSFTTFRAKMLENFCWEKIAQHSFKKENIYSGFYQFFGFRFKDKGKVSLTLQEMAKIAADNFEQLIANKKDTLLIEDGKNRCWLLANPLSFALIAMDSKEAEAFILEELSYSKFNDYVKRQNASTPAEKQVCSTRTIAFNDHQIGKLQTMAKERSGKGFGE